MRMTWILEDRLAASGMISTRDLPALADLRIRAVVSLTHRNPFPGGSPDGLGHLHLPVLDMTAPTRETIDRAVAFLAGKIGAGEAVLVHCAAGYGRTGTIVACYLASIGLSADEAVAAVRSARPGSIETFEQEQCVRGFARSLGEDR